MTVAVDPFDTRYLPEDPAEEAQREQDFDEALCITRLGHTFEYEPPIAEGGRPGLYACLDCGFVIGESEYDALVRQDDR